MARVLVVDDESGIRETLNLFLTGEGYEVETAKDVHTALSKLETFDPDVVVSDIVMPKVSGIELLEQLRAGAPKVKVIMITGEPTVETASEAVRQGAFDYLSKPVPPDDISLAIFIRTALNC